MGPPARFRTRAVVLFAAVFLLGGVGVPDGFVFRVPGASGQNAAQRWAAWQQRARRPIVSPWQGNPLVGGQSFLGGPVAGLGPVAPGPAVPAPAAPVNSPGPVSGQGPPGPVYDENGNLVGWNGPYTPPWSNPWLR